MSLFPGTGPMNRPCPQARPTELNERDLPRRSQFAAQLHGTRVVKSAPVRVYAQHIGLPASHHG